MQFRKDSECICKGNWRELVEEVQPLLDKTFLDNRSGKKYKFFGLVHGSDDYYYGLWDSDSRQILLASCVGSLEVGHGYTLCAAILDGHPYPQDLG